MHIHNMPLFIVGISAIVLSIIGIILTNRIKSVRHRSHKDDHLWRGWLTINDPDYMHRGVDLNLEVAYGYKKFRTLGLGWKMHFGNRGSETPFHLHIYLIWVAIFFSMNTPNLGRICEKLGRGHKRDIGFGIRDHSYWWTLWYDDDMGYDEHHRCDKWRELKWWPFKNRKYRSWACLRDGNLPINPLNAMWGHRYYSYEKLATESTLFGIYQFEDDIYNVDFTLQKEFRERRNGPKWARRRTFEGFSVDWECKDKEGIPFRNHSWKGDGVYSSGVKIDGEDGWLGKAEKALQDDIIQMRERYNYNPPVGKIIEVAENSEGISITAIIDSISGQAVKDYLSDVKLSLGFTVDEKNGLVELNQASPIENVKKEED